MIPAWLLLSACLPAQNENKPSVYLELGKTTRTTDEDGLIGVEVEIPEGAVSFQITGDSDKLVSFDQLIDPNGDVALDWQDWLNNEEQLTLAFAPQRTTTALSWPVREEDGPLLAGVWTVWMSIYDEDDLEPAGDVEVDLFSEAKIDDDLDSGQIAVQIVWARGVENEPGVKDAVEEAVERWAEIWAEEEIELQVRYVDSDLDSDLDFAFTGDEDVEDIADDKGEGVLQLVIGDTVDEVSDLLGLSAGIPGTIESTPNTFVVLSWLTHAGRDGEFDEGEIRIMGETMAHEVGHYTGLFHPVEGDQQAWDALDDTAHCSSASRCEDELGENLMYPYPLCDNDGCVPQGDLSSDQKGVMQRYVGAL